MSNYTINRPIILITGATDGIGLALARLYHNQGAQLVLVGRRSLAEIEQYQPKEIEQSGLQFSAENYCQTDLSLPGCAQQIRAWLETKQITQIDCLIHNAGVGYVGPIGEQSVQNIHQLVAVNVAAPIAVTHALLPLVTQTAGQIAFISSVVSSVPAPDYAVYGATKAALDGFVRNLQIELRAAKSAVTAHLIRPGATGTGFHAKSGASVAELGWHRFPSAENVAAKIMGTLTHRRATANIGLANHLLYNTGHYLKGMVEWGMKRRQGQHQARDTQSSQPKHCVITGAADGIGKALAYRFAQAGYQITGIDVDGTKAAQTQAALAEIGADCQFIITNLAEHEQMRSLLTQLKALPPVDLLIHNAGINAVGYFAETNLKAQSRVLDVNLTTPLLLTAGLLSEQQLSAGCTIVGISSLSHFVGYPGAALYAASKDGLQAYLSSLAVALADQHMKVLTVYPGPTRTAHARRYSPDNQRESSRMSPDLLATYIERAVQIERRIIIPGVGNKLFAIMGKMLPQITERVMERAILDRLK